MLYCIVLCCVVLCCVVLHCIVLHCIVLYYVTIYTYIHSSTILLSSYSNIIGLSPRLDQFPDILQWLPCLCIRQCAAERGEAKGEVKGDTFPVVQGTPIGGAAVGLGLWLI